MTSVRTSEKYIQVLRRAVTNSQAWSFTQARLAESMQRICIDPSCIDDIIRLLEDVGTGSGEKTDEFSERISAFQRRWRPHLDRVYFVDYEALRWPYVRENVLSAIDPSLKFGRCLDLGCGRGCLSMKMRMDGVASEVVGIDQADFESEWRERKAQLNSSGLEFANVSVANLGNWLSSQDPFDTVLLYYVLHHSDDYWVAQTLHDLFSVMKSSSRLIILEDAYFRKEEPVNDPFKLAGIWRDLADKPEPYSSTAAFHVQTVMDFVAVQLLANFDDVEMPCNYLRGEDWISLFESIGFKIIGRSYIGFPRNRDIDVPQAYFVLGV